MKLTVTPSVAPSSPQSAADRAAHVAASFVRRPLPVRVDDSGLSRAGKRALRSVETEAAYFEKDAQLAGQVAAEIEMAGAA